MQLHGAIDSPLADSVHSSHRIPVEGWVYAGVLHPDLQRVSVQVAGSEIASTSFFGARPDVCKVLHLDSTVRLGFRMLARFDGHPGVAGPFELEVRAEFGSGASVVIGQRRITLVDDHPTDRPYGDLCDPSRLDLLHREHIYSSGLPSATASPDCVDLLQMYLPPNAQILDVGCGIGAYCAPLQERGHVWTGCESSPKCLTELVRRGLPHRAVRRPFWPWSGARLPATDREFDAAIVIEVLEHVRHPKPFLAEVARVVRTTAFFSVPNSELIPCLYPYRAVPWHLLERDHKNFFTRANLQHALQPHFRHVEILSYAPYPLPTPEGTPLDYHLFALCRT